MALQRDACASGQVGSRSSVGLSSQSQLWIDPFSLAWGVRKALGVPRFWRTLPAGAGFPGRLPSGCNLGLLSMETGQSVVCTVRRIADWAVGEHQPPGRLLSKPVRLAEFRPRSWDGHSARMPPAIVTTGGHYTGSQRLFPAA